MKVKHLVPRSQVMLAFVVLTVFLCVGKRALAISPPGDIIGKVMCGYQGWLSGLNDGSLNGNWSHYGNTGTQSATNCNRNPAKLYSPWDQQTVTVQFQWMQQNGIDGVGLQRFGS